MARKVPIHVYATSDQAERIRREAEASGRSISGYMLHAALLVANMREHGDR